MNHETTWYWSADILKNIFQLSSLFLWIGEDLGWCTTVHVIVMNMMNQMNPYIYRYQQFNFIMGNGLQRLQQWHCDTRLWPRSVWWQVYHLAFVIFSARSQFWNIPVKLQVNSSEAGDAILRIWGSIPMTPCPLMPYCSSIPCLLMPHCSS